MNTFFKKYFWVVTLVGIALVAMLVAGGVNDFIGSKLFVLPKAPDVDAAAVVMPDQDDEGDTSGRVANEREALAALNERLIFDLTPPEPEKPEAEEPEVVETVEPEKPDDGELEESSLAIDLIGTMVATDADASMATITVEGENKLAWIGSEFLEGKAKIAKIAPRHIVIQETERYTVVKLWSEKGAGGPSRPGSPINPVVNRPPTVSSAERPKPTSVSERTERSQALREGVKKSGAYDYEISRSMLDEELKDLGRLQAEARVVPHYRNQKYEGFKLVGVRPGSLYRALGIRSGDVIKSVNGVAIDSPNKALQLFEQLKNSSDIKVDVERRGQPKTLGYTIR